MQQLFAGILSRFRLFHTVLQCLSALLFQKGLTSAVRQSIIDILRHLCRNCDTVRKESHESTQPDSLRIVLGERACAGLAIDEQRGHIYYCFTTVLVKTDLRGTVLGTVGHLAGHMGCITIDPARRRLYGSLELKHDIIGQGIIKSNGGGTPSAEDSFYLASFDIDRIDRIGMDAEADGVMKAVYLRDVVKDYTEPDERCGLAHRYGCSGIDGIGLGPVFGTVADSRRKIMIAYGIYSQPECRGNDTR